MVTEPSIKVLIVEDELIVALNLSKELTSEGYTVLDLAANESEAVSIAKVEKPTVILMDINLESGGSGISAAKQIREFCPNPIIYLTAYSSDKTIELVGQTNPYGYILKPYNIKEIKAVISTALVRYDHEKKINNVNKKLNIVADVADIGVLELNTEKTNIHIHDIKDKYQAVGFVSNMRYLEFVSLFVRQDAQNLERLLKKGAPFSFRARVKTLKNSKPIYLDVFLSDVVFEDENIQIGAIQDVSEHQSYLDEIKLSGSIVNQMSESVVILNSKHEIVHANLAFKKLIKAEKTDVRGKSFYSFMCSKRGEDKNLLARILPVKHSSQQIEATISRKDGKKLHVLLTASLLKTREEDSKTLITLTDVTKIIETEHKLGELAFKDPLTGFGNRASLYPYLQKLEASCEGVALFFIDLDSFKNINDSLGHDFGDEVIRLFAQRLRNAVRETDYLIRLGGDEFVILATDSTAQELLVNVAQKIQDVLLDEFLISNNKVKVTASIGIVTASHDEFDLKTLLKKADIAMYQAKKAGKNRYCFYDRKIAEETEYRISIEQGLKSAITNGEIFVHFQPIVNIEGRIVYAEVLCRWYSATNGYISPEKFIPLAEETYLISELGYKVIKEAFLAKKQINSLGNDMLKLSINMSENQLNDSKTIEFITQLITELDLEPAEFIFEITESTMHKPNSGKNIRILKDMGFCFATDDFGTGYSSLSSLHEYSAEVIKIDKSFIQLLGKDERQTTITKTIFELLQKLDYICVAEGVETAEQFEMLKDIGCEYIQGFFFYKPMRLDQLLSCLQSSN